MINKFVSLFLAGTVLTGLTACGPRYDLEHADYWEPRDMQQSIHVDSPHLQEAMNRDLAACVRDMREQSQSRQIHGAMPATPGNGGQAAGELAAQEPPETEGHLLYESSDYHDFEGCMLARGWSRTADVPYPAVEKSQETFLKSLGVYSKEKPPKYSGAEPSVPRAPDPEAGNSYLNL